MPMTDSTMVKIGEVAIDGHLVLLRTNRLCFVVCS